MGEATYLLRFFCEWGAGCLWPGNDAAYRDHWMTMLWRACRDGFRCSKTHQLAFPIASRSRSNIGKIGGLSMR